MQTFIKSLFDGMHFVNYNKLIRSLQVVNTKEVRT
jgi:hypothetical protein|nr:MAG TPA: hypothetical protein [Caudoviricetes sp.]